MGKGKRSPAQERENLRSALAALEASLEIPGRVDEGQEQALLDFGLALLKWNRSLNLTGAKTSDEVASVLFADALILATSPLLEDGWSLIDVGAGAGAPAIPLLILRPDLSATLLEPIRKRVAFMQTVVGASSVALHDRSKVIEGRFPDNLDRVIGKRPFDVAMSRATFDKDKWLAEATSLAPKVLVFATEPGGDRDGQIAEAEYRLPSGAPRVLTLFEPG